MMKTNYSLYAIWDDDLQCILPDTLGVLPTDRQYVQSVVRSLLTLKADEVADKIQHLRFLRVGQLDVSLLPAGHVDFTDQVLKLYNSLKNEVKE